MVRVALDAFQTDAGYRGFRFADYLQAADVGGVSAAYKKFYVLYIKN